MDFYFFFIFILKRWYKIKIAINNYDNKNIYKIPFNTYT